MMGYGKMLALIFLTLVMPLVGYIVAIYLLFKERIGEGLAFLVMAGIMTLLYAEL